MASLISSCGESGTTERHVTQFHRPANCLSRRRDPTIFVVVSYYSNRICLGTVCVDQTLVFFSSDGMSIGNRLA